MRTIRSTEELTAAEIRLLLQEKLRQRRYKRLHRFRQTGRAITLVRDPEPGGFSSPIIEIDDGISVDTRQPRSRIGATLANHLLGFLEIGITVSFVVMIWLAWQGLSGMNQRAAAAWIFPTPTPTPLIRAIVLPEGHTPPNLPGGSRPNIEEVPAHLRPVYQWYANLPTPTSAPQQGVRIQILALKIDAPIVQGDGWEELKKGVAQHLGTANPGEKGNMVLSGHNDTYGEVFRFLDRLKPGDQIIIFTYARTYTYVVEGWRLVNPDQVEVMEPTPDEMLTLISCYPYLVDTQRIVVKARLQKG